MASLRRIASRFTSSGSSKITISSFSYYRPIPLSSGHGRCMNYINNKTHRWTKSAAENLERSSLFPSILFGLLGLQLVDTAFSDSNKEAMKNSMQPESPPDYSALEKLAREERRRLEELLKSKGMFYGSYPKFSVAVKGQKVTIKFQIPKTCDISHLIARLVLNSGVKVENGSNSEMIVGAWDSAAAWQLTLHNPTKVTDKEENSEFTEDSDLKRSMLIILFGSLLSSEKSEIEFIKEGSFSTKELEAIAAALKIGGRKMNVEIKQRGEKGAAPFEDKSITNLEALGVRVFGLDESLDDSSNREISWENIAGYDQQKQEIEDTIVMALHRPEVYDDIARGTRSKFESNRPRAVLFEGPPGTGKTSSARVIAHQAGVPMLYVPLEIIMSKYYGESERILGKVFLLANELPNGAIIFLDEVDSFAVARDTDMHEATRRILSILLRQIDGFEQDKKVVVIAATNRKQDLDPALISRFDSIITFDLPDLQNREAIAAQYAKQLSKSQLAELAEITQGMSGRDIRDVCQQAERHWASKMIRSGITTGEATLPPLQLYIDSAIVRKKAMILATDVHTPYRRGHPAKVLSG